MSEQAQLTPDWVDFYDNPPPKDGSRFDVWLVVKDAKDNGYRLPDCRWDEQADAYVAPSRCPLFSMIPVATGIPASYPSYWMPKPKPPKFVEYKGEPLL